MPDPDVQVRRAFLIQVELTVHPDTTLQDVALMTDKAFSERDPKDFEGQPGCLVYEITEARP